MGMVEITSREKLESWLENRPPLWSAAVALRAAMRVLPFVCKQARYREDMARFALTTSLFRCCAISWVAGSIPTPTNASVSADSAAESVGYLAYAADHDAHAAAHAARAAARAAADVVSTAANARTAADAAAGADASAGAVGHVAVWHAISSDCTFLDSSTLNPDDVQSLLPRPLWQDGEPDWFVSAWVIARNNLSGFDVWIDWFQRRIDGEATGFALSPNADAEMGRRLVDASNDWWAREPAEINADIKAWLAELTPPVAEPNEADFTQNPRALTFGADADGQIGLAPDPASNRLLDDADAQDRHAELLREAKALQSASQHGQTQATDLDQPALDFIEAVGESLATTKPSWLVARGEKLRRMRKQRHEGTSLAPPLSERQAEAIDALITALDIMVGLDPYLLSIRQASYDPDSPRGTGDTVAIRLVIDHALAIKVARADAHGALADAVANVPANAAPDDRRRLTLWADFKNFIQATGRFIWKHKGKIGTGVASAIALIQLNAATLKGIFAASPTMLEIIRWIEMIKLPG